MNHVTRVVALGVLCLVTTSSEAQLYSHLVNFGASRTDTGNVGEISPSVLGFRYPISPPHYEGRVSNGPVWVEILADHLGVPRPEPSLLGGTNYALGATTTGAVVNTFGVAGVDVSDQVASFLEANTISGNELFLISSPLGNDLAVATPPPIQASVDTTLESIRRLTSSGAKHLVVSLAAGDRRASTEPEKVALFNSLLKSGVESLRAEYPSVRFIEFDSQSVINGIVSNPSSYGINFLDGYACVDCVVSPQTPTNVAPSPNEYLYWDSLGHYTASVNEVVGKAAYDTILDSKLLINEHFDVDLAAGQRPEGTTLFDSSVDAGVAYSWGPGIIDVRDGKIRFETSEAVPPHGPPQRALETGFMNLSWDVTEDNEEYANGYFSAIVRADTPSDVNLTMRGNLEALQAYLFTGWGSIDAFRMIRYGQGGSVLGHVDSVPFEVGRDYHMEAGTVGNRISMKVWAVGDEEPELPQLVVFDDTLKTGLLSLTPATSPETLDAPAKVDATYDNVRFLPSVVGDVNQNTILDPLDIDQLSDAVFAGVNHPFYDFLVDETVDENDRRFWVEELAGTSFGDTNLDGIVDFADFLVLSEHFGTPGGWSKGDFNGDKQVGFPDFLLLSENFGATAAMAVPEPRSNALIVLLVFVACCSRHRKYRNSDVPLERF